MTYLEDRVATALRGRAERQVDADALLRNSLARGRTRQRRHRITAALGGAGVAGATAVALAAAPLTLGSGGGAPVGPGGVLSGSNHPGYLPSANAPGAASHPDLVGTDPRVLHFALGEGAWQVSNVVVSNRGGVESLALDLSVPDSGGSPEATGGSPGATPGGPEATPGGPGATPTVQLSLKEALPRTEGDEGMRLKSVKIELARGQVPRPARSLEGPGPQPSNAGQVVIAGRPGTVEVLTEGSWVERAVRWQPVDGLEMRVGGARLSTEDLVAVAEAVKLDRTTRCSAPLRLANVPAGARLLGCDAVYRATGSRYEATATLTVGDDAGAVEVAVRGGPAPAASWNASPTALPGGTTAGWVDGASLTIFDFSGCQVDVTATGDYGHDEVAQVAQGLRRQGDLADPSTWPADPIG